MTNDSPRARLAVYIVAGLVFLGTIVYPMAEVLYEVFTGR